MQEDVQQMQKEINFLRKEVDHLKDEMIRLISRNIDLSERLEYDVDLWRRAEVAREIMSYHVERQRNADLQDDGQLMALIEIKLSKDQPHLKVGFCAKDLADLLGVSMERLNRLFRKQVNYRTPDAYIDKLRVLAALRLLREKPNYTIAVIAQEAGFANVRTLQRRIHEVIGMTPVEYRLMVTRDLQE